MDVTLNAGDPVKAARQPTNGHPHPTGTAETGRLTPTTAVQPSQICFQYQFYVLFILQFYFTVFFYFFQKPEFNFLFILFVLFCS